jgi:hypothetical protein
MGPGFRRDDGVVEPVELWVSAERLPQFLALFPQAHLDPPIAAPSGYAEKNWSPEEALIEILRGRLEGLGPVTEAALAAPLGLAPADIAAALAAGQIDFGENYAQELRDKAHKVRSRPRDIRWHFIGPLQRNKVKYVVGVAALVHSVDGLSLLDEIARRAAEVRTFLPEVDLRMRRTPDRCVVQAGPVGLSVSWLPVRSDTPARGILLVIEWDGTVTLHGETQSPARQATPVHEHVLHLAAGSAPDWRWCGEDESMRAYSSSDLAAQCVHLLLQRLRAPAAV